MISTFPSSEVGSSMLLYVSEKNIYNQLMINYATVNF